MPDGKDRILLFNRKLQGRECEIVTDFDELSGLVARLFNVMYRHEGIGLAAPQIGIFKRLAVIHLMDKPGEAKVVLINPVIVETKGESTGWEGCLSIPGNGTRARVKRAAWIRFCFQSMDGKTQYLEAEGLFAKAVQHEIDHLYGRFYVDHLSPVQRGICLLHFDKAIRKIDPIKLETEYVTNPSLGLS